MAASPPNALADIQYASIINPGPSTPTSDDDSGDAQEVPTDDARSIVAVSIGQAQTRLTSPTTPAIEKTAALEDLDGGGLFKDNWEPCEDGTVESKQQEEAADIVKKEQPEIEQEPELSRRGGEYTHQTSPPKRLPSPWRAGSREPRDWRRTDISRNVLRDSLGNHRRRASAGATEGFRRFFPFHLPSLPTLPKSYTFFTFPLAGLADTDQEGKDSTKPEPWKRKRASTTGRQLPPTYIALSQDGASSNRDVRNQPARPVSTVLPTRPSLNHRAPSLRRSTSDSSLLIPNLSRAGSSLSRAPSLGDDSRWENVREQVNSRAKAIRDSFQDSNFKLPSMSLTTLPNFAFSSRGSSPHRPSSSNALNGNQRNSIAAIAKWKDGMPQTQPTTAGMTAANAAAHPYFTRALSELAGDLVILGGYRGSILRSAEPPYRQLWVPIKVGLNLRKVDLEVGLERKDEENMRERIIPGGMLTHIGPVDIGRRLLKRLRSCENAKSGKLRVHEYGYDWRLSPDLLSRDFIRFLEGLPCNSANTKPEDRGAIIVAHSLGGLVTRHAINKRPELVAGVVYTGTPQHCVNILGPLRNGDDVLLSSRVLTAQVNFTVRTSFALLPLEGHCFFDKRTKEEYPVDFFNHEDWIKYAWSPCIGTPSPSGSSSNGTISSIMNTVSSVLDTLPSVSKKGSIQHKSSTKPSAGPNGTSKANDAAAQAAGAVHSAAHAGISPQMGSGNDAQNPAEYGASQQSSISTAVTIPRAAAIAYLKRVLAEVKLFKQELAAIPSYSEENRYPPATVIYGKSTPTVYGAKVNSREGIRSVEAYDELAFASGDGVVLARAAMLPEGYEVQRGGCVSSERGHISLLGDLEAVGSCLLTVMKGRRRGVGLGPARKLGKSVTQ